jgi:hypothetical protein
MKLLKNLILALTITATLLLPARLDAQALIGTITAASASCLVTNCVVFNLTNTTSSLLIDISGTWTGTIQLEFSTDSQVTWKALSSINLVGFTSVTSTTSNGTFATTNPGYTHIRVRASAWSSGTGTVLFRGVANQSVIGVIFGGSAATIGSVTQGTDPWNVSVATLPGPSSASGDAISGCYLVSTATTNATNCKASAGNFFGVRAVNTTSTIYYLRLYNLATAPTCSSATGFIESIPIPHNTGTGGGIVAPELLPTQYTTGIGFCLTGGGSSTDNTAAATGVYLKIGYK